MKKKAMLIIKIVLPFILLYFLITGVEINYKTLRMPQKNPTEYTFNVNIDTLKNLIFNSKDNFYNELGGFFTGLYRVLNDSSKLYKIEYLKKPWNKDDFVYYCYYGLSNIYVNESEWIGYAADFHIHLEKLDKNEAHVKINTCRPRIKVRVRTVYSHAPGFYNTYYVDPSTIEEYKILLVIGEKLGIREKMPKLILPG